MIRLGSLAGYSFEGPRVLAGWTPPAIAAVFTIMYRPDEGGRPGNYAVIYADHGEDLTQLGLPFRHPAAPCWIARAGNKYKLYIATFEVPGGLASHRQQIVEELCSVYQPGCNDQQFDPAWKDEWIGSFEVNTHSPLTTKRDPKAQD